MTSSNRLCCLIVLLGLVPAGASGQSLSDNTGRDDPFAEVWQVEDLSGYPYEKKDLDTVSPYADDWKASGYDEEDMGRALVDFLNDPKDGFDYALPPVLQPFAVHLQDFERRRASIEAATGSTFHIPMPEDDPTQTMRSAYETFVAADALTGQIDVNLRAGCLDGARVKFLDADTYLARAGRSDTPFARKMLARGYDEIDILDAPVTIDGQIGQIVRSRSAAHLLEGFDPDFKWKSEGPCVRKVDPYTLPIPAKLPPTAAVALPVTAPGAPTVTCEDDGKQVPCFHAALSLNDGYKSHCSGTMVAPGWVLGAAHCVCEGLAFRTATTGGTIFTDDEDTLRRNADINRRLYFFDETARVPAESRFCKALATRKRVLASNIATRSEKDAAVRATAEALDLVLLKLAEPHHYPLGDPSVKLLDPALIPQMRMVYLAGFGRNNSQISGGTKTFFADAIDPGLCAKANAAPGQVCLNGIEIAIGDAQADFCFGDSGAGVYVVLKELVGGGAFTSRTEALLAVGSRGIGTEDCGTGGVAVLASTDEVRAWIERVTGTAIEVVADIDAIDPRHHAITSLASVSK